MATMMYCTQDYYIYEEKFIAIDDVKALFEKESNQWRWLNLFLDNGDHFIWINQVGWYNLDKTDKKTQIKLRKILSHDYFKCFREGIFSTNIVDNESNFIKR